MKKRAEESAPVSRGLTVDALSSQFSLPILSDLGLGLNQRGYVKGTVGLSLTRLPDFDRRGAAVDIDASAVRDQPLRMTQRGAVLSDPWVPGSEDNFAERVEGLVVDEVLRLAVLPGTETFGNTLFFIEGRKGQDPELRSETRVLPSDYLDAF